MNIQIGKTYNIVNAKPNNFFRKTTFKSKDNTIKRDSFFERGHYSVTILNESEIKLIKQFLKPKVRSQFCVQDSFECYEFHECLNETRLCFHSEGATYEEIIQKMLKENKYYLIDTYLKYILNYRDVIVKDSYKGQLIVKQV